MKQVLVGIVTYNSLADLPGCLTALAAQTYSAFRVVVLDNASQDGCADWLEAHVPAVQLLRSKENLGYGRGHNAIIAAAPAFDAYLALNPDARLSANYIAQLVQALEQYAADFAIGKLLLPDASGRLYSAGHALQRNGYCFNIGHEQTDQADFATPREIFGAPGAAVLYATTLIRTIAPNGELFDADMFMYGEDTDVDWRSRRAGLRCWYVPAAQAWHRGSTPREWLRVQAVTNRYLSCIKNAFMRDLLLVNMPMMLAHTAARLVLSPRYGWQMLRRLLVLAPRMWHKRTPPRITAATMNAWFAWSAVQPTTQAQTLTQRILAYLKRRAAT